MAFDFTQTKANVEALITALTGSEDYKYLVYLKRFAQGQNASNIATLDTAMQTMADNQTSATPLIELTTLAAAMGADSAKTHRYYDTEVVTLSDTDYPVPANAISCFVSCSAGHTYQSNAGYTGGAYIVDYEIGVSAGGTINVSVGAGNSGSHVIGGVEVNTGGLSSTQGKVFDAGVEQAIDSVNVFQRAHSESSLSASSIELKFLIEELV